jgi:thiamine-phosphate pyrophosphorylase
VENGATAVQLRLKGEDARTLLDACRALVAALRVPLLVHDRADVAVAGRAAGVHVSRDEIPAAALRAVSPPGFVIGASVGTSDDLALSVGADYVSVGPVFGRGARATGADCLGVEGFSQLVAQLTVPASAVGGVTAENVQSVLSAGAVGVAVITGAYAKAEAARTIRDLRSAIGI